MLAAWGVRLLSLGGSAYYWPAGLTCAVAGIAVLTDRWRLGGRIYLALWAASFVWGLWEAGLSGWALAPRVLSPAVLGLPFLIVALIGGERRDRLAGAAAAAAAIALVTTVSIASRYEPVPPAARAGGLRVPASDDWPHYANLADGAKFSPLDQIDRSNVSTLKVAWRTEIGPMSAAATIIVNEGTPLKVGDHLYFCTPYNTVMDLDPETGQVRWRFDAKPDMDGAYSARCRGLAYYAVPNAAGPCARMVYTSTMDARLIALDAETGALCPKFGSDGQVDLLTGLQQRSRGYYWTSSPPALIRGKLVVGGGIGDNQYVGQTSGVIRAYDAVTGKLAWAWDLGDPGQRGEPQPGQHYTPGTPNAWAPMSADETLGLVYVPLGSATPDYWGGHRSPVANKYANALVALDAETGEPRWSFQTSHYDLWDYDVPAQPVLFDLRTAKGAVPAVLQPTKRGQLFLLDQRTGKPLFPVEEKPVPQRGAVEKVSPTQPFSVALPDLSGPRLKERSMWGLTALDQLWCRVKFRESRYDGTMTPPGLDYSIADPGFGGGVNWGGATIDTARQLAYLPSKRLVNRNRLLPRSDPEVGQLKAAPTDLVSRPQPQEGTPYAAEIGFFFSPLAVPCQAPPYGLINAVDLTTGRLVWSRPLGSARDLGPMQKSWNIPFTIGTFSRGGAMSTASGLVFIGAANDHAFRAFDGETGALLFEADLPGWASSSPMSYRSAQSGRQFVVVASEAPKRGGAGYYAALTAFVLPDKQGAAPGGSGDDFR